jgi:endoglucanase
MANQTAYLDGMLRWGLDYLIKVRTVPLQWLAYIGHIFRRHILPQILCMFLSETVSVLGVVFEPILTFCLANTDDNYWGGDLDIPQSRPSYQINSTNPGTDAAAGASAAFSACSALYSQRSFNGKYSPPASLANSSYAAILLTHAQQLYSFAVNATGGQKTYQTSAPAVAVSYKSSSFRDELTIAALFLAWATNSTTLYQQAEDYYSKFGLAGGDDVFNWDSKTAGLAVLFSQITQSSAGIGGNLTNWQQEAERYFDDIINQKGRGKLTKSW